MRSPRPPGFRRLYRALAAACCVLAPISSAGAAPNADQVQRLYRQLTAAVDRAGLQKTFGDLAAIGPRIAGSSGEQRAFQYVERRFRALGLANIRRETFSVTVPDPEARGSLAVGGRKVELLPLWPNLARTSTCDLDAPIVYGGDGSLEELSGKRIDGSIVLLEFASGSKWRNAARLGASAIVFLEPDRMLRGDAEHKFSQLPLSIPRFYLPLATAGPAITAAIRGERARLSCQQRWVRRESANLIADLPGSDPGASGERILLSAPADSMSIVPALAPGGEGAAGIAALVEAAEFWKRTPHRRPISFMLSGAHFLALQGAREFVDRRLRTDREPLMLAVTLDLSSGSPTLASYGRGWFYDYRDERLTPLISLSRILRVHATDLAALWNVEPRVVLTDAVNNSDNRPWRNNIPARFAFDCEPMVGGGYAAITLATIEDSRDRVDTPADTADRVDLDNVYRQTQTAAVLLHHVLNDTSDPTEPSDFRIPLTPTAPSRMTLVGGFATVSGYVAVNDPAKSFVPDLRVPDSLAVWMNRQKTMLGVRGSMVQYTSGPEATFEFRGLTPINAYATPLTKRLTRLAAFKIDERTGNLSYAPDWGMGGGGRNFFPEFELKTSSYSMPLVVFPSRSVDLYGLTDPQDLSYFDGYDVLDAKTNGWPLDFGLVLPEEDMRLSSDVEDVAVLFLKPGERFKLVSTSLYGEQRLILTNSSPEDEAGQGYLAPGSDAGQDRSAAAQSGVFADMALNTARDIAGINEARLREFRKYRIISPEVEKLQATVLEEIRQAEQAAAAQDWSESERHSRAAWGFALRAHPVVQKTSNDVINGVLFYLFLLIPFSYFLERLLFGHRNLTRQLGMSVAIFIASFLLLRAIHPAFEIVTNPTMIFVGFVTGVLSMLVIVFIVGKFETSLKDIQRATSGLHEVDIRRGSVAMAAFNLGVSNMRRRKARTLLTTLTLVVMTFIVLSFTSIVPELQIHELPSDTPARYSGLLLRSPALEPLVGSSYRLIANEFARTGHVGRRAWYFGAEMGDTGVLTLRHADKTTDVRTMVGLDPEESRITRPQQALLPGGRWFQPGERDVMILPSAVAATLQVAPTDVGKATVRFAGREFTVIGIVDGPTLRSLLDLDGDSILPADFTLSKKYQESSRSSNAAFRKFLRIDPSLVFFVPAQTAIDGGADLRTIAVGFDSPAATRAALDSLMPRLRLNLYGSVLSDGTLQVRQFSILQGSKGTGLLLILIQLAIASIFVLNTMIASVYERTKEISIFSAIGLAPNHIAMLFFAESLVYGVLGAVFGYISAQVVAKVITATGALPGLFLNFSSTSAVMAAGLVMAVVLGSTVYPARKASQIAAPALSEEVFESEPDGDTWTLPLPFSVGEHEAAPLVEFLGEWLRAYEEYTIGNFVTSGTRLSSLDAPTAGGPAYTVETTAWLAPYDLGVSQRVVMTARPAAAPGVYEMRLDLTRVSGEAENWVTVNGRFLADMRKQFLTWRTLTPAQRERYETEAARIFAAV